MEKSPTVTACVVKGQQREISKNEEDSGAQEEMRGNNNNIRCN